MAGTFLYEKELAWVGLILTIISTILLIRVSIRQHRLADKQEELTKIHLNNAKNGNFTGV